MKFRLASVLALIASVNGGSAARGFLPAQNTQDTEGIRLLLQRLERTVQAGDVRGYLDLLSQTADREGADEFAATEILAGATRVVVREREREPLLGTLPGSGYRMSVDAFSEFGSKARSATWTLDVKRVGDEGDLAWRIAGQRRLSVIENLYKLSLNQAKQFDARDLTISVEDLDLAVSEGTMFVAEIDQGTTGLVIRGRGEVHFHPEPAVERGQLKIFCGAEALNTRFDALFIRMNPFDFDGLLAARPLTPRPIDQRDFRRAEELFREGVPKSYAVDLSDLSREVWSLLPAGGDLVAEIRTARYDTLTYAKSSAEAEDLSFFDRKRRKNICVYTSQEKLARRGRTYNEDDLAAFDVLDYDIEVALAPDRQWIDGRARLQMRVQGNAIGS